MNTAQSQPNSAVRTIGAVVLIGIGALFLLTNVFGVRFNFWGAAWPLFIIVPGVAFLALAFSGGKSAVGFVFPGAIITGTGLILAVQNMTNHWESWAYVWTLYPVFVGAALSFHGTRTGDRNSASVGRNLISGGLIAFFAFGALFELIIFGDNSPLANLLIPLLLIGAGAYLLFGRRGTSGLPTFEKPKRVNPAEVNPSLQRKIDEALAEEPEKPKSV